MYQSPLLSKSNSFNEFDSKNLSKYFSGIVAFDNENNFEALNFFKSSKILINQHDPYLERFVLSLVLENKVAQGLIPLAALGAATTALTPGFLLGKNLKGVANEDDGTEDNSDSSDDDFADGLLAQL